MRTPFTSYNILFFRILQFVRQLEMGEEYQHERSRDPVRKGTLSKDIKVVSPVAGNNMNTLMTRINFVGVILMIQIPIIVFIATMTDLLHPLSGMVAIGSFILSVIICIYKMFRAASVIRFGLYITIPCCITSSLMYWYSNIVE